MDSPISPMAVPVSTNSSLSEPPSPGTRSRSSSRGSLKLDLTNLPPLTTPSKPSNTLLITNLQNTDLFHVEPLQNLRNIIASHADIVTWSPLKSFRRIVCSFTTDEEAIVVRQALDGSDIMGDRCRVYFGEHTPVNPVDQHLQAPESKKLFFISPPPSPPHGWEVRNEGPPNIQVLAEDLAAALKKLRYKPSGGSIEADGSSAAAAQAKPEESTDTTTTTSDGLKTSDDPAPIGRTRSGSVLLFTPEKSGSGEENKNMPSISVDDFTDGSDAGESIPHSPISPIDAPVSTFHTSRPPVELMNDA
ncbi:Calcipressin-domain-containing protein [Peziza echinospora]|nr:Calcipressin-domain-containing protein [Peziza echinospora]